MVNKTNPKNKIYAIEVNNLVKNFGNLTAVNNISFSVNEGEIYGLLGPNGAGKTTTISILTTMLSLTSGNVRIFDKDIIKNKNIIRQMLGIVFQDPTLDEDLTAFENLDFHARLYDIKENKKQIINNVLKLVELEDKADKQVKSFSGGMKRRLEIARGFIHQPKILFLDEPTIGLDPQTRRKIWDYIKKLNEKQKITIILTTHYLEEADELCDRVSIIDHGKIIKTGTPKELKSSLGGDIILINIEKKQEFKKILSDSAFIKSIKQTKIGLEIIVNKDGTKLIPKIVELAAKSKININSIALKQHTLEDVFISLTGKNIRDSTPDASEKMKLKFGGRR